MKPAELTCLREDRRLDIRRDGLHGLDFLEVSEDQRTLTVSFLGRAPEQLKKEHVRIVGGQRIRDIAVVDLDIHSAEDSRQDDHMVITVDRPGDFSTYTLCLVEVDEKGCPITERKSPSRPPYRLRRDFDPRYACLEFNFKVGCPTGLDCKPSEICPPPVYSQPDINYLAKDYASFRQLILDRLSTLLPDWQERHVPDLGVALTELLAYAGDYLSYRQDAVATEAYLGTARQRISVRRHARLMDYQLHEGCNARAWVVLETGQDIVDPPLDPKDLYLVTSLDQSMATGYPVASADLRDIPPNSYEVFEPLREKPDDPIRLYQAHNEIQFYTWGNQECCLPKGATKATLKDEWDIPRESKQGKPKPEKGGEEEPEEELLTSERQQTAGGETGQDRPAPPAGDSSQWRKLQLQAGDVLILEEVKGPKTGYPADAALVHRHAVRLTSVTRGVDPLYKVNHPGDRREWPTPIVEIEWPEEDAVLFPLCLSSVGPAPACTPLENISVARGNVILADHGRRVPEEDGQEPLPEVPGAVPEEKCRQECEPLEGARLKVRFRPHLRSAPLTFSQPIRWEGASASALLAQDPRRAVPQVELVSLPVPSGCPEPAWRAKPDLLASRSRDCHFVVEIGNDGRAHLRFGDGEQGRAPDLATRFSAAYRVGNGPAGNVGAEALSHVVLRGTKFSGLELRARNPLPAQGGASPEPLARAKLLIPKAFQRERQRAIIPADYAELAMRGEKAEREVQRAAAVLRWNGSWHEVWVTVDPLGSVEAGGDFLASVEGKLHRYRRIGHDLVVAPARYVPLDIKIEVCIHPDFLRGHVRAALLDVLSNRTLPDGELGFFHPDNLSFGEGVSLSRLIAAVQNVPGVESVNVCELKLERLGEGPNGEVEEGFLSLGPLEIAQLDNDPTMPENGQLRLELEGGR